METIPNINDRPRRPNRGTAFQAYHDDLLKLVPTWEQRLAPDEVAFLVAVGERVFQHHHDRYRRWLDDEERAA